MKQNTIEFDLSAEQLISLAAFIAGLNQNGVPYTLRKDNFGVAITVGTGC